MPSNPTRVSTLSDNGLFGKVWLVPTLSTEPGWVSRPDSTLPPRKEPPKTVWQRLMEDPLCPRT